VISTYLPLLVVELRVPDERDGELVRLGLLLDLVLLPEDLEGDEYDLEWLLFPFEL
jgi:hypothetical protein